MSTIGVDGSVMPYDVYVDLRTMEIVESSGGGWTTWYYGYGRSVSFDRRGRAQSLVGFPGP